MHALLERVRALIRDTFAVGYMITTRECYTGLYCIFSRNADLAFARLRYSLHGNSVFDVVVCIDFGYDFHELRFSYNVYGNWLPQLSGSPNPTTLLRDLFQHRLLIVCWPPFCLL